MVAVCLFLDLAHTTISYPGPAANPLLHDFDKNQSFSTALDRRLHQSVSDSQEITLARSAFPGFQCAIRSVGLPKSSRRKRQRSRLWPLLYRRDIDPRQEVIAPARARRKAGYGQPQDHKQELRDALKGK